LDRYFHVILVDRGVASAAFEQVADFIKLKHVTELS
jgi:hypothetical protein